MKLSIIHPSKGRPDRAQYTRTKWLVMADMQHEYILSIDLSDTEKDRYWKFANANCSISDNKSAIEAINHAARKATGDILIVISDDFDCPEHWDTLLLEAIGSKQDFCAKTSDGHQDWLITLPIMDRKYYERFGYVYHPDFSHMHADLDLTCRAWMLGKYIKLPLEFKHNHYSVIGEKPDAINIKNNSTWGKGRMLFNERLSKNFDLTGDLLPLPILPKY